MMLLTPINSLKSGDYNGAALAAAAIVCKACKGGTRVRHYTNKSGLKGIKGVLSHLENYEDLK